MSYILEALRKLERRRQQGDIPTVHAFQGAARPERRRRWPYVLAALLLLNGAAAVILWYSRPWGPSTVAAPPAQVRPEKSPPVEATDVRKAAVADAGDEARSRPSPEPGAPDGRGAGTGQALSAEDRGSRAARPSQRAEAQAAKAVPEQQAARIPVPPADRRIHPLKDLPPSVKGGLPELRMSVHVYSPQRQERMAMVNNKRLTEGQDLAPGLTVAEITPQGVVFLYQGYRFLLRTDEGL